MNNLLDVFKANIQKIAGGAISVAEANAISKVADGESFTAKTERAVKKINAMDRQANAAVAKTGKTLRTAKAANREAKNDRSKVNVLRALIGGAARDQGVVDVPTQKKSRTKRAAAASGSDENTA